MTQACATTDLVGLAMSVANFHFRLHVLDGRMVIGLILATTADAITDNVLQRQYMFYVMLHDHT